MRDPKSIFKFIGLALAIYLGLILLVSGLGLKDKIGNSFRSMGQEVFGSFKKQGKVDFQKHKEGSRGKFDVHLVLMNKQQMDEAKENARLAGKKTVDVNAATMDLNTWRYAVIPGLFVISLILASPMDWKRKSIALLLGILVFSLFILFRLQMDIAFYFYAKPSLDVVHPGAFGKVWMEGWHKVFSQGFAMIVAIFIWLAVAFPMVRDQGLKSN